MKKSPKKVALNWPRPFFSVLQIGPNPAQISIPVPKKSPTAGLLYNDFAKKVLNLLTRTVLSHLRQFEKYAKLVIL